MSLAYLAEKIKQKKELRGLADSFVEKELNEYIKRTNLSFPLNKKTEKKICKAVRAELRNYTGQFQHLKQREHLIQEGSYLELLKTHASTRERLPNYSVLKEIIANLKPRSILDIGCGLNPIALASQGIFYYASDIKEDELEIVSQFFKKENIKGKVFYADARTERIWPKADLCLLLKIVDLLDKKGHKKAEELIRSLNCKHIIVSFSTKTLSGRPMNHPQRGWIERLCARLGYKIKLVKTHNELFYLIIDIPVDCVASARE